MSASERELVCSRNDCFTMSGSFGFSKLTSNVVKPPCKVAQVGPLELFQKKLAQHFAQSNSQGSTYLSEA